MEPKDKSFLDWLFGASGPPEAELALHLSEAHLRIEQLEREIEQQRISRQEEQEAFRHSLAEAEARLSESRAELEISSRELANEKAAREAADSEIIRLTRAASEARGTAAREAELRKKIKARCSLLERGLADLETTSRAQVEAQQAGIEQRQKELSLAKGELDGLRHELKRQKASHEQARERQHDALQAERHAWAGRLGQLWRALVYALGPAAPLALETSLGQLERVPHASSTEAAEARLREFLSASALCSNVKVYDEHAEFRLELEPATALEGSANGWLGVLATRYLAAMLDLPLRTRRIEYDTARLRVHASARIGYVQPPAGGGEGDGHTRVASEVRALAIEAS